MKRSIGIILLFVLGISSTALAQLKISAEYRPRVEVNRGYVFLPVDTSRTLTYVTQRARLKFDYEMDEFSFRFSLQDVRTWGDGNISTKTGVFGYTEGLDIYEAWMKWHLSNRFSLKLGRQEIRIDDERLVSWRNWNQYGLTYDAARLNYSNNGWDLSVVGSYNNRRILFGAPSLTTNDYFTSVNRIKTQNFIHLRNKFSDEISASVMVMGTGFASPENPGNIYLTGTYGLWAKGATDVFDIEMSAYYQNGKAQTGKDVSAYMASIHPGFKAGSLRIGAGLDYISGDDAESSDYGEKEKTFNRFYGAVYKYLGNMNQFTYLKGSTKNGGLMDIYPNLQLNLNGGHTLAAYYHIFSLANPVFVGEEVVDEKSLGSELDLRYVYKYNKYVKLQAGFSYYFVSDTMEKIKGVGVGNSDQPYWSYVMLVFKPTLFTTN